MAVWSWADLRSAFVIAASYASSSSNSATTSSPPPPPPKSNSPPSPIRLSSQSPLRPTFLSYFASTTPDSPSKRARIKTLLLLQSLGEGKKLVVDIQDKITGRGLDKILGLEMAILHSKVCHVLSFLHPYSQTLAPRDDVRSPPHRLPSRHCTPCGIRQRPSRMHRVAA